jgi:nitroreductase/polysaccharide pyruvyl transferase WcaK-like protein
VVEEASNGVLSAILERRSVRQFTSQPVPQGHLDEIVRAGVWAPTGSNQQEVRFLVTTDRTDLNAIWAAKSHIKNPQAAILVYVDTSNEYYDRLYRHPHRAQLPLMDTGAACQNMLLAAHSLGLGACWLNLSPHIRCRNVAKRFALGPNLRLVGGLFLGYPARVPDLGKARHGPAGRPARLVQRGSIEEYLVRRPPMSRVLCVHSLDRDNPNLGSQAIGAGLRKALHQVLQGNHLGVLGLHDYHLAKLDWRQYLALPPEKAVLAFRKDVKDFASKIEQARGSRPVGLDALPRRLRRLLFRVGARREELVYLGAVSALSQDPLWDSSAVREAEPVPRGCVVENGEIRVPAAPVLTARSRFGRAVARRLHRLLPRRFPPVEDLRATATSRLLDWAQVVLLDGNGNIADTWPRVVIDGLFNLALAKALGAAAYSVNQTVDLSNPVLRRLMRHVYNSIDGVVVREPISKRRLEEMGVEPHLIKVGADCAILVEDFKEAEARAVADRFEVAQSSIGLALRADMSPDLDMWAAAVSAIEERFKRKVIYFNSTEETGLPLGWTLREKAGITVIEGLTDYSVLIPLLSRFSVVVSQCYHPLYFSILAQTPFVALRGNTFKAAGLLEHLEYPIPVFDNPSVEEVLDAIQTIMLDYDEFKTRLVAAKALLKEKALNNVEMVAGDYASPAPLEG